MMSIMYVNQAALLTSVAASDCGTPHVLAYQRPVGQKDMIQWLL